MPTHTQTQTQNRWFSGENQRGGPLKTRIVAIFQTRKSTENPEISKIGRKKCSHVPMFPEIFPKLPRIRGVGVVPCNHATIAGMAGMAGIGRNGRFSGENQRGGPLKTRIFAIFEIRKSAENPENSKIGWKKCSHVPMFPEIFPKLPQVRDV